MGVDYSLFSRGQMGGGCHYLVQWFYPSDHPIADMLEPGYFDGVAGLMTVAERHEVVLEGGTRLWIGKADITRNTVRATLEAPVVRLEPEVAAPAASPVPVKSRGGRPKGSKNKRPRTDALAFGEAVNA